jgi:uncharacterized protein YfcZ (UPF0381/DUF406 family)
MQTMQTTLFKETGVTEGACGKILDTENQAIVIKKIHRHLKHRSKCLNAEKQCQMQIWAHELLTPANGFSILYTPRAWYQEGDKHQYYMDRIDCSHEIDAFSASAATAAELKLFYEKAKEAGIFPCDYELYRQSDGRIALIDFDKFGVWSGPADSEQVVFPWGLVWTKPLYPW